MPADDSLIFISYRRQEASYLAAWLHDALTRHFGVDRVFLDIDSIRPGADFLAAINEGIARSALLLLLIGPQWLASDSEGRRRLDDPRDPVRQEMETALEQGTPVIPVLLDKTAMPRAEELPYSVASLSHLNAVGIRYESLRPDTSRLLQVIDALLPEASPAVNGTTIAGLPTPSDAGVWRPEAGGAGLNLEQDQRQRARLLRAVDTVYSEHLRQSLEDENAVRLTLPLVRVPGKTVRPADRILSRTATSEERQREGTSLLEVFDQARGLEGDGVLVLGAPGAGKTTLVVELARQLTHRARADPEHPVPVYLPLSSWATHQPPLAHWLAQQLDQLYRVAPPLAYRWIGDGRLLFILDALSDIPTQGARAACVREINRFNRFGRQFPVPMVVTTRQPEYDMLSAKLQLETAVAITPLDAAVVLSRLREAGDRMRTIVAAVESDPEMLGLLRSPLLLSMLTLTYAGLPDTPILPMARDSSERRRELVSNYVDRRFELGRQGSSGEDSYPPHQTLQWLGSLARNLVQGQQTVLLLDRLQSGWVPSPRMRRLITLAPSLTWGLAIGVIFASVAELSRRLGVGSPTHPLSFFVIMSVLGLVAGLATRLRAARRLVAWTSFGLAYAVSSSLYAPVGRDSYSTLVYSTLVAGLSNAIFFGLLGELAIRMIGGELPLTEHLSWSWKRARSSIVQFLLGGSVFAVAFDVPNWLSGATGDLRITTSEAILLGLAFGLVLGLFFSLSLGLVSGLRITPIPTRPRAYEGLINSVRHGLILGLGGFLIAGTLFFVTGLLLGWRVAVVRGLTWGPSAGVLWGLTAGLGAVVQYFVRRLLLWGYGLTPLRYAHWLNYAVSLRLLYRGVGGGYLFIHPFVQDYFASQPHGHDGHGESGAPREAAARLE